MVIKATRFDDSSMRVSTDGIKINDGGKRANQQRRFRKKWLVREKEIQENVISWL